MSERRLYETTFIVNAALEDNDIEAIITKVSNQITNNGGTIQETNKWGRRRLAYPINKKHNGYYVHTIFQALPEFIPQLERSLTLDDTILRHLTLQLSQELLNLRTKRALEDGQNTFLPDVLEEKEVVKVSAPAEIIKEIEEIDDIDEIDDIVEIALEKND
jgi:small subunit ribosomal protein S6